MKRNRMKKNAQIEQFIPMILGTTQQWLKKKHYSMLQCNEKRSKLVKYSEVKKEKRGKNEKERKKRGVKR